MSQRTLLPDAVSFIYSNGVSEYLEYPLMLQLNKVGFIITTPESAFCSLVISIYNDVNNYFFFSLTMECKCLNSLQ